MKKISIEYCSLFYLNQWILYDEKYNFALNNPKIKEYEKIKILKEASIYYRIARNFPTKYDEKKGLQRLEPVYEIIKMVKSKEFSDNPVEKILRVKEKISNKYGGIKLLSATTKILWIKIKHPIIIYDSQAVNALGSKPGDLNEYYHKWKDEYNIVKKEIKNACLDLEKINKYVVNQKIATKEYIRNISQNEWFHERVFDAYLWHIGDNSSSEV